MRLALALAFPVVTMMACSSTSEPTKAMPSVKNQQIASRLHKDIWPAVSAYNLQRSQGSAGAQQFHAIIDPSLRSSNAGEAYGTLRDAAQRLGQQGQYDSQTQTTHSNDGLTLSHTDIESVNGGTAKVDVCYTYTHSWYVNIENTQHAPAASGATVELINLNNVWYLRGIANDHVVPSCPTDKA